MSPRTLLIALCVILGFGSSASAMRQCSRQSECIPGVECCSKRIFSNKAYCVKFRQLNDLCLDRLHGVMLNRTYDISCPCAAGLTCIKDTYYNEYGQVLLERNPRCRAPGYEPPPMEETSNNFVETEYAYRQSYPQYPYDFAYPR